MKWNTLITEIQAAGWSQGQIAKYCGCTQGFISQIKNKKLQRVSYEIGKNLSDLHGLVVKDRDLNDSITTTKKK